MNYSQIYTNLIDRARGRIFDGYTERHHVIPRSLGGSNDANNIVRLTPEEHYLAHQLLLKLHPNNAKMIYAARCLATMSRDHKRVNNKLFGWIRRKYAAAASDRMKNRVVSDETKAKLKAYAATIDKTGSNNHFYGKTHTPEVRARVSAARKASTTPQSVRDKISQSMKGVIHSEESRRLISEKLKSNPKVVCPHCGKVGAKSPMTRHHFDNCKFKGLSK